MSVLDEEKNSRSKLMKVMNEIAQFNSDQLVRPDLPHGGFTETRPLFDTILGTVADVKTLNLSGTPTGILSDAINHSEPIRDALRAISTMSKDSFDQGEGALITRNLEAVWRNRFSHPISLLFLYGLRPSVLNETQKSLAAKLSEAERAGQELIRIQADGQSRITHQEEQYEILRTKMREQTKEVEELMDRLGVASYAERFQKESNQWDKSSKIWLVATLVSGIALLIAAYCFGSPPANIKELHVALTWGSNRLVTLSIFSIAIFVCLRNYAACRHNCIVNRHRQNALLTFDVFNKGTSDDETKKAILLQSMQAIFAPQPTGYLKASETQSGPQIVEFIKNTIGSDKS